MADVAGHSLLLLVCLIVLSAAADAFLSASQKIGLRMGISPFAVGISIVAFGTSAPELIACVIAVATGSSEIVAGTVVGSNVTNILFILAAAAVVGKGIRVDYDLVRVDLPFLFGSALLFALFVFDGRVGWLEGCLLLGALAIYIAYAAKPADSVSTLASLGPERPGPPAIGAGTVAAAVASLLALQFAAWGTVRAVVGIASLTPFGTDVLAASLVALGTSLPEMVISLRAAREGKPELAVGNVIGSNVFNVLGVVGVSALVGTINVTPTIAGFGVASLIGSTVLCFFVLQEREVTRWDGGLLLILYVGFVLQLYGGFV